MQQEMEASFLALHSTFPLRFGTNLVFIDVSYRLLEQGDIFEQGYSQCGICLWL